MLPLSHGITGHHADGVSAHCVDDGQEAPVRGAAKTKHPLFIRMLLNVGFHAIQQDGFFSLLTRDLVPAQVLGIAGVPKELHDCHGKYNAKQSQG